MPDELHLVLMAGGSGTRFWPASRSSRPKQFLPLAGQQTMLAQTLARVSTLVPSERTLVVCGQSQRELVLESLPELPPENILAEPCGRNTLPCIALATCELERRAPGSLQIVLPADHVIEPLESFQRSLLAGIEVARERDSLVTFGIEPSFPATGYGYIELGPRAGSARGVQVFEVSRFEEKPGLEDARAFLASGRYLWNSGMFVWKTSVIARALETHAPEVIAALRAARQGELPAVYQSLASAPIDKGVMEPASNRHVLPIDYRWSDVGSWSALADVLAADELGLIRSGAVELVTHEARDCIVHAEDGHTVALVGVEGLIVVQTKDATLICPRERDQDVREIVAELARRGSSKL